mmetsp:Transcript_20532/g.59455  ORF Transcript_20532/g.59455 Transcript_20532/m.59455 type:complete len:185 (-) Transcript_20532:515-1069(-)
MARTMLSMNRARALLQELLAGFSSPRFQRKLASSTSDWGRRELILDVQRDVLPRYGFEGNENFHQLALAMQPFAADPRVAEICEAIAGRLAPLARQDALAFHAQLLACVPAHSGASGFTLEDEQVASGNCGPADPQAAAADAYCSERDVIPDAQRQKEVRGVVTVFADLLKEVLQRIQPPRIAP